MILKVDGFGTEHARERYRCMTDLFYLGTKYLGYDFTEKVHRPICDDFFIKKDPDKPIEAQSLIKNRLLLDPREHYKTTEDACDIVQWIIAFPDIRICVFSGIEKLAKQIMEMARNHFLKNDEFKNLFPEHAIDSVQDAGNIFEFTTPARTDWRLRDPSLTISTIESTTTGGHFNVIKFDDIVTPQNSANKERLEKVIDRVKSIIPLVVIGGYRDFIGTRYDHSDAYGYVLDLIGKDALVQEIPFGQTLETKTWKAFIRAAATMPFTSESEILFTENVRGDKAFDYDALAERREEMGDRQFGCQYFNDPQWGEVGTFLSEDLEAALVPFQAIPLSHTGLDGQWSPTMRLFISWDLAFSEKKTADFTVGAVGGFDQYRRLFLLDLVCDRFSPENFVYAFIRLARKWQAWGPVIRIEEAGGSKLIQPALKTAAANFEMNLSIDWSKVSNKTTKLERVFGLLPLLKNKRFFINKDIDHLEELKKQFTRFPRYRHDDIPDAVVGLLEYQDSAPLTLLYKPREDDLPLDDGYRSPIGGVLVG